MNTNKILGFLKSALGFYFSQILRYAEIFADSGTLSSPFHIIRENSTHLTCQDFLAESKSTNMLAIPQYLTAKT